MSYSRRLNSEYTLINIDMKNWQQKKKNIYMRGGWMEAVGCTCVNLTEQSRRYPGRMEKGHRLHLCQPNQTESLLPWDKMEAEWRQ